MASIKCLKCQQWYLKKNDLYCGFCGQLQIEVDISPKKNIVLVSRLPNANKRKLTCTNSGFEKVDLRFMWVGIPPKFLSIDHSDKFTLQSGEKKDVFLILEEDALPQSDFIEKEFTLLCILNEDDRQALKIPMMVRTGPKPVADEIDFRDVRDGDTGRRMLRIRNEGAIPARLKEIHEKGAFLKVEKPNFPLSIGSGKSQSIPVLWDTNLKVPEETDDEKMGIRLVFEHDIELFVPVKANIVRIGLATNRKNNTISIPSALSKQNYTEKINLKNTGNADIEITGIECEYQSNNEETHQDWLEIISRNERFTILSKESVNQGKPVSPTVLPEEYKFKALIRPQKMKGGWNHAYIIIHTSQDYTLEIPVSVNVVTPKPYHQYIGIDFGTTNSVICIYDSENDEYQLVNIENRNGEKTPLIPSILFFDGRSDNYKIGWDAADEAVLSPQYAVRSIKRIMGYGNDREFYEKTFTPNQIAGCIIKTLVELAEVEHFRASNGTEYYDIRHAIVTVPANFYDLQIRGILEACHIAGLDTEKEIVLESEKMFKKETGITVQQGIILDEPSAGAIFHLTELAKDENSDLIRELEKKEKLHLLVFDYGGGTLDISIVQVKVMPQLGGVGIEVLANKGDNSIGGDSIDLILMNKLLDQCREKYSPEDFDTTLISIWFKELENRKNQELWSDDLWGAVLSARDKWKNTAEEIKKKLSKLSIEESMKFDSHLSDVPIFSIKNGEAVETSEFFSTEITRGEFETLIAEIIGKCIELIFSALDFAEIKQTDIDYVFHTGRSSYIPLVQERVKEVFAHLPAEKLIFDEKNLKTCVAQGAARYGTQRHQGADEGGIHLVAEGRKLPHAYGISKSVGILGARREFEPIISIKTKYPLDEPVTRRFEDIKAPRLNMVFLQNSGFKNTIRNNPDIRRLGEVTEDLKDLSCEVSFNIDANRTLEVLVNGKSVDIVPQRLDDEQRWIG